MLRISAYKLHNSGGMEVNISRLMRNSHNPTVGPTSRANWSVQQLCPVNIRPTGWSNRLNESNMSNSSNQLNQQMHRKNVHPTVGSTVGPTMQMRSPNRQ